MRYLLVATLLVACSERPADVPQSDAPRPSILLITLDTTRADVMTADVAPNFTALAARGRRFRHAYATTPQTLPSHASMMTGLYPAGHGVHENGRFLPTDRVTVAEKLKGAGYRTAAFVSAFAIARRFGLARGFETYDEEFGAGQEERSAEATTDRALAFLAAANAQPLFLWVHYYDPHYPYSPPEAFRSRFVNAPYRGEVAAMDAQLGRLVQAFQKNARGAAAIVVAADHGEGLGDHDEEQHGNLLYQATMHVPLILAGPGVAPAVVERPVSTRRIFHTILDWAGIDATDSLRGDGGEPVVVAEAMKPYLDYGWQPQIMAVEGSVKAILAGKIEVYDVVADPSEAKDLSPTANLSRAVRATLREYPVPSAMQTTATAPLDDEAQRKLASLGYVSATSRPPIRADAPRPADMASLFPILDRAAGLFVREQYAEAIPLLEEIQRKDPMNLDAALRLAVSHSSLGNDAKALDAFKKAEGIAPDSQDVRAYLALHLAKGREWQRAIPLLERIVAAEPNRLPPIEALALLREREGRFAEALTLRQKILTMKTPSPAELLHVGNLAMRLGNTAAGIDAFERARAAQPERFRNHLELGVLYLAAGRLTEARDALDRVPPSAAEYPMVLFKRAQVSVLLRESDSAERIARARERADATTRALIERERLFR